jgi:hypothetical protein
MRVKPLSVGSIDNRPRVLRACVSALAVIWLGTAAPTAARASACPNAQFRTGPSEQLPDCRAYEQVSPAEKSGLDAVTLKPVLPTQASPCEADEACAFAYMNATGAFDGAQGNNIPNAYLATRGTGGWQTTALTPPTPQGPTNAKVEVSYAFSSSLSQAILRVPLQQLTEGAPSGVFNLFLREPGGAYSLVTSRPPLPAPKSGCVRCFEAEDVPAFAGASSDFSHVIFEASDSLVEGAPGNGVENLYEAAEGGVRLVGVLPDGAIPPQGATAGGGIEAISEHTHELTHAISENGSRVLFEAAADSGGPDPLQAGEIELYDRIDGSSSVEVSAPAAGAEPAKCETRGGVCNPEPARFWGASANGSLVYFTSKAALTQESYTGVEPTSGPEPRDDPGDDLYQYDVDTGKLTDLTADAESSADPSGAGVLGVVGASEDGSYVYFVANGHLDGAPEGPGSQPSLYVWHETTEGSGTVRYIATLAAPEEEEEANLELLRGGPAFAYRSDLADWTSRPTESQAYVTPDGRHIAFMSVEPLTGYANEGDHEVYEYSVESGELACASCDADGAAPLGSAFIGARLDERASTPFHQPRTLSDDGSRLFFSSPDPLVPGVPGGSDKIFEYENGAVQLISGSEGGGEAVFLDASSSGDDVFFATREQLAPSDNDELADVYDARVDGGLPESAHAAPCQGEACQEPFAPEPSFAAPISESFTGPGNLARPPAARPTRKQLLTRALVRCARMRSKKKRAACADAAKRRYAPKVKSPRRRAGSKRRWLGR